MRVDAGLFICIGGIICCCAFLYRDKIDNFIGWKHNFND